jgi:hypothetical protein
MSISRSVSSKNFIAQHLQALRHFASQVLVEETPLTENEDADCTLRMREFLAAATSLKLTQREMVGLLYQGLFGSGAKCDCPACRLRHNGHPS